MTAGLLVDGAQTTGQTTGQTSGPEWSERGWTCHRMGLFSFCSSPLFPGPGAVVCAGQHAGLWNADERRKSWWSPRRERRFRGQRPGKQEHQGWSVERGRGSLDPGPSMVSRLVAASLKAMNVTQGGATLPPQGQISLLVNRRTR